MSGSGATHSGTPARSGLIGKIRRRLSELATFRARDVTFLYAHDLANIPTLQIEEDCSVRRLNPEEVAILKEVFPLDLREMQNRLRLGYQCYAGFLDGKVANYGWVQTRGRHFIRDAGRWHGIRDGEFWIFHCRTAGWARGRRIYPLVLIRILEDYRREGFVSSWIYTRETNIASRRGIERAGFVLHDRLVAMRLGPLVIPLSARRASPADGVRTNP